MTQVPASSHGGGAAVTAREQIFGNNVTIANVGDDLLTWDTVASGDSLLNLTVPSIPSVIAAGIYAITVNVQPAAALTAAGFYRAQLEMDAAGDDAFVLTNASPQPADGSVARIALNLTYYVPAAGSLQVRVWNLDGVSSRPFKINTAIVQRIS